MRNINSGDPSLSVLELWGAEYQENCALLLRPEHMELFKQICARENCTTPPAIEHLGSSACRHHGCCSRPVRSTSRFAGPASFVGQVSTDGRVVLEDSVDGSTPVDLPLSLVLADMPKKTFKSDTVAPTLVPLSLPAGTTVAAALDRVLRLPSVGSKRFLTNKVRWSCDAFLDFFSGLL